MSLVVPNSYSEIPENFYDNNDSDNVCFNCEKPAYSLLYEIGHFGFPIKFQKCRCGIVKQTPMPNEAFFEWFFNSEVFFSSKKTNEDHIWGAYDYFADEGCRLATSRYRYKKLSQVLDVGRPLDIMKIGPSTGTFLYVANQQGHRAIGCDVSTEFVEFGRKKYGVRIDNGRFERKNYPDQNFDRIFLFNVIENIPNLAEFLESVHDKIKNDGYFIFNFTDMENNIFEIIQKGRYSLYRPPVCYVFTKSIMETVLRKFGFEVTHYYRDKRYMHLEKILTLLGWHRALNLCKVLRVHRIPFLIYAYPSHIVVARKVDRRKRSPA